MVLNNSICLALALNDKDAILLPKAQLLWPKIQARFQGIVVHHTESTHPDWVDFLQHHQVPCAVSPQAWNHIGQHRRRALALAVEHTDCRYVMYSDPDHLFRWLENEPPELNHVLDNRLDADCLILGRTKQGFENSPARLRDTEASVNHVYKLLTGNDWDLLMAMRVFSKAAAEYLVQQNQTNTIGNDVAWPLMLSAAGFKLDYVAAEGIKYQTDESYMNSVEDHLDLDAKAWARRIFTAHQHIEAMAPYLD